jgi:nucleotide sugar dehydrogenase
VQGLGFVGAAMAIAVACARREGRPAFDVVGVELDDPPGRTRAGAVNDGRFPFPTVDGELDAAAATCHDAGNLVACADPRAYGRASVVLVDVALDVDWSAQPPRLRLDGFTRAIDAIGDHVRPGALVIVETTVPPGTTERIVVPRLAARLEERGLPPDSVLVAHSYERVMPGPDYLASIVGYWRVYAGHTEAAADACEAFLSQVIEVDRYPLRRVSSTTASETAKVLENSFRATTIALTDEWSRFAEHVGLDLFEVVEAIRDRPTHANIRTPGFGVGGYCLTKDPLFGELAARELYGVELDFPFSIGAVERNRAGPLAALDRVRELLGGHLAGARIVLLGVSYKPGVGDTRHSPSETFTRAATAEGVVVDVHDPLVRHWEELGRPIPSALPAAAPADAVVFAVAHPEYRELDVATWLGTARPVLFDACGVLSAESRAALAGLGCTVASVGRGREVSTTS